MKTFAIHSPNDADILIRMHDDLVKAGFESNEKWNKRYQPIQGEVGCANFEIFSPSKYRDRSVFHYTLGIGNVDELMMYLNHYSECSEEHRDLTPDNYDSILSEIIEANKPQ